MNTYVALLRGINVGGNNIIKMTELKECFESIGFAEVLTYIQSGNVIFKCDGLHGEKLIQTIEAALTKGFNKNIRVVTISQKNLHQIVIEAPSGFGMEPEKYRYDVIFLKQPLTAAVAMKSIMIKEGVDTATAGTNVLYFSRLIAKASQSRLSRIIGLPVYQNMTIRNWNTTTKLLALMEK